MNLFELYIHDRSKFLCTINSDNVNTKLKDGTTLLHISALLNDHEATRLLLDNSIVVSTDYKDDTALDVAVRNDHYEVFKLMIGLGRDPCEHTAMENNSSRCLRLILKRKLANIPRKHGDITGPTKRDLIKTLVTMCYSGFQSSSLESLEVAIEQFKVFIPEHLENILTQSIPTEIIIVKRMKVLKLFIKNGASFTDAYIPCSDSSDKKSLFRFAFEEGLIAFSAKGKRKNSIDKLCLRYREFWTLICYAVYKKLSQNAGFIRLATYHHFFEDWLKVFRYAIEVFNVFATDLLVVLFAALVDSFTKEFGYVEFLAKLLTDDCVVHHNFVRNADYALRSKTSTIHKQSIIRIVHLLYKAGFRECSFCKTNKRMGDLTFTQQTNEFIHQVTLFELLYFHFIVIEKIDLIKKYEI